MRERELLAQRGDLRALALILVQRGPQPGTQLSTASQIPDSRGMNIQGPELFFSDRAARPCGRFAAVARLRPREDA